MRLRRLSGPVLAFLLVAGMLGVARAQNVADPHGILIRVDAPADGAWAGIGDTIRIRVLAFDGILDAGFHVAVADATVRDRDVGRTAGVPVSRGFVYYNIYISHTGELPAGVRFGSGETSGVDTFRVSFAVSPQAAAFESEDDRSAKVVIDLNPGDVGDELNNLMTDLKITPASTGFGAARVGDGVRFGIDANRPVHGAAFDSFSVETEAVSFDTTDEGLIRRVRFKRGDEVAIDLGLNVAGVLNSGASRIRVGVVDADSAFSTAPVAFQFSGDRLYRENLRDSERVKAGDFGDNRRVRIEAYLADAAGNLGGASMADSTASPVNAGYGLPHVFDSLGVEWIADAAPPVISVLHPHPDSLADRISGAAAQTLPAYRRLPWETDGVQADRWLNPLEFRLSEAPDSIRITHGDSAHGIGSAVDDPATPDVNEAMAPTGGDSTARLHLPWKYGIPGGVRNDLKIEVWDSLGNASSMTLAGIWYDGKAPAIGDLFPSEASAPRDPDNEDEPTINLASKDPVFTLDEALDSLSIRYVETGGATAVVQSFGPGNVRLETIGEPVHWPVDNAGFYERNRYDLQILAIDRAGNASLTDGGTFAFSGGFLNPNADAFRLSAPPGQAEAVVAGRDYAIRIAVLDTTLTRAEGVDVLAATYHAPSALAVIVSEDQAAALEGVSFSGTGVSPASSFELPAGLAAAGRVARAAVLDADGWRAGQRDVALRSTRPIANATVMAAEYAIDPATGARALRISGRLDRTVNVEAAELSRFEVSAWEGGAPADGGVAGAFTLNVLPTDAFGNASMKIDNVAGSESYASVTVSFSSSHAAVKAPIGQQAIPAGGADFGAVAADLDGSATIVVRTTDRDLVTGAGAGAVTGPLTGSLTVRFGPEGRHGLIPGAPAAPASIAVEDWLGADGSGDQGGLVLISFPKPAARDSAIHYLIEREIETTLEGYDADGSEVHGEAPVKRWTHWARVGFAGGAGDSTGGIVRRAVIPALDNAATHWGVRSVLGAAPPAGGKRVFTRESVAQTLRFLGISPDAALTDRELMDRFNAPEDVVGSLIGNRPDLVFVPAGPDAGAVPAHIRTAAGGGLLVSARTVTEAPAGAVDNLAPAAVTGASGSGAGGVALRWTASVDDRIVGAIPYRGYNVPIPGVKGYRVMRGASEGDLAEIAALPPGVTRFEDEDAPQGATSMVYRIDAFDDNNVTPGDLIAVDDVSVRAMFEDAGGNPVYLIVLPSLGGSLAFDFEDFVAFAAAFNSRKGDANYNPQADLDDDGVVAFADFVKVVSSFGRIAAQPAAGKRATTPPARAAHGAAVGRPRGVNADAVMTLELAGEKVLAGETISLTASVAGATALNGFGLELAYDADRFEFLGAALPANDLLKSEGGETPLFMHRAEEGRVSAANAIIESGSVSGDGALATFTFRVLRAFEDRARFEIARGVVFDANQLRNPVVSLGALDVRSTPATFALHQNFPNPFNPRTGIRYDLAEGGHVALRIYNLLGQEVRTLVRERQAPGRYTVHWNGTDDLGAPVSSGIYFYQITVAGRFQTARRLTLLR